jgi:hypothetical protein
LELDQNEACHSIILAWLLDRRIEQGSHAQGSLGFRLFLEEFGRELGAEANPEVKTYHDDGSYWALREFSSGESRVDIEIAAYKKFVIHIENKIMSAEGPDQTGREWRDLQERARQLHVPRKNRHALFLTLDASQPESKAFRPIGWSRVAKVLDRFSEQARPRDVKLFASHYAAAVRKLAVSEPEPKEIEHAEAMAERPRAVRPGKMGGRDSVGGHREVRTREVQGTAPGRRGRRASGAQ